MGIAYIGKIGIINLKVKVKGFALYINENLVSRHHEILPDTECEDVWVRIFLSKTSHFLVGVRYRSPSSTTEENMQLTTVIETATNNCALIFGDLVLTERIWMPITAVADLPLRMTGMHSPHRE